MIKLENSLVINRPVEEVFAFVDNPENEPQWNQVAQSSEKTLEGPMGVGAAGVLVARFLGRTIEQT